MRRKQSTEAEIRLSRSRIIYNLSNNAYVVGDGLEPGHGRHLVHDVVEGQNFDHVDRVLWRSYCKLRQLFQPYIHDGHCPPRQEEASAMPSHEFTDYTFHLSIPGVIPRHTIDYWAILADEYILCEAMAEWLSIVSPPQAPPWQQRALQAYGQLAESLHLVRSHARKRMEMV